MSGKGPIGITSTVPAEIIFAAGYTPVDLNNIFISSANPASLIKTAEAAGFPVNYCAWMKGIYGALKKRPDIKTVIGVSQGDCGNTTALTDLLAHEGYEIVPFSYPAENDPAAVAIELERLAARLGTTVAAAEETSKSMAEARRLAKQIDVMTWQDNLISGEENHLSLVNMSDFQGDPLRYADSLARFINEAKNRTARTEPVRLGLAGVPPIISGLYSEIEKAGARVVYNEVQYEFAMAGGEEAMADRYAAYTYPYGAVLRAEKIGEEIQKRGLNGLIHYVQSFCYHQLDDIVIRESAGVPVLRLEADMPGAIDGRTAVRLEAFIETLT